MRHFDQALNVPHRNEGQIEVSLFNDDGSFAETPGGTGSSQNAGQSGRDNKDSGLAKNQKTNAKASAKASATPAPTAWDIATGALKGAAAGSIIGPVGTIGGALAGGLYSSGYSTADLPNMTFGLSPDSNQTNSIMAANEANQNDRSGSNGANVSPTSVSQGQAPAENYRADANIVPITSREAAATTQDTGPSSAYGGHPPLPTDIYGLASGFVNQDNPMMRSARTAGMQQANQRGLLNSSMGIQAAQKSVIDAALPAAAQMSQQNQATNLQRENIAAYDREKAASLAAAYESTYTGLFQAIMNNPNIPAAARENYLAQIGMQRDSNLGLLEQFYNIKLDWSGGIPSA